jgi:hypothetical protein
MAEQVQEPVKKRRARKNKYVVLMSPHLMKETKHEYIGEPFQQDTRTVQWARCTRTHHSQLVDLEKLKEKADALKSGQEVHFDEDNARDYDPRQEYKLNDTIKHKAFDDYGVVKAKEITSNGKFAILVKFQKSGEKRLIERYGA